MRSMLRVIVLLTVIMLIIVSSISPFNIRVLEVSISPGGDFVILPPGEVLSISFNLTKERKGSYSGDIPAEGFSFLEVKYKIVEWRGRNVLKVYIPNEGIDNCVPKNSDNRVPIVGSLVPQRYPDIHTTQGTSFECDVFAVTNATMRVVMRAYEGVYFDDPIWRSVESKLSPKVLGGYVRPPGPISIRVDPNSLLNYTVYEEYKGSIDSYSFPSPVYTAFTGIPDKAVLLPSGKRTAMKGNGSMFLFTMLFPLFRHKEGCMKLSYDYTINLSQERLKCPKHRLRLLIYSGHGNYSSLDVLANFTFYGNTVFPTSVDVEIESIKPEELCPSDIAVLYACLTGYPGGMAYQYSQRYSSVVFAYTEAVPVSKVVDKGVSILIESLVAGEDPSVAYATYLAYYILKAPDPEWVNDKEYRWAWDIAVYASAMYVPGPP